MVVDLVLSASVLGVSAPVCGRCEEAGLGRCTVMDSIPVHVLDRPNYEWVYAGTSSASSCACCPRPALVLWKVPEAAMGVARLQNSVEAWSQEPRGPVLRVRG